MEMTRVHISFTFDPRDMLLSLQMGFSFVRAAVAGANSSFLRVASIEKDSKQKVYGLFPLVVSPLLLKGLRLAQSVQWAELHITRVIVINSWIFFSYFSMKTYIVTPYQNRLSETVLMKDHNICLDEEIWKIIPKLSLLPYLEHWPYE